MRLPGAHSFDYMGTAKGCAVYYTSPAKAKIDETVEQALVSFKQHLNEIPTGQCIWILDCGDMEKQHTREFSYVRRLTEMLIDDHAHQMNTILIIRPNLWLRTILGLFKGILRHDIWSKIVCCEEGKLATVQLLESKGLPLDVRVRVLKAAGMLKSS